MHNYGPINSYSMILFNPHSFGERAWILLSQNCVTTRIDICFDCGLQTYLYHTTTIAKFPCGHVFEGIPFLSTKILVSKLVQTRTVLAKGP